ncbi:hypothetical protein COO60DRAFT_420997 [Scenedesmus sp. NREL 46B-D3]|nr:hypothetical protein COO60DRAFT_420997 [Scenedesmus sp. NREL 46B-D3]
MLKAEQQAASTAAGADTAQEELESAWLYASTSDESVEQLAQQHKLTQQQLRVLLNVQRQFDATVCWRIITMPDSAGMLSGHMIVELKQHRMQPQQSLGATSSSARCVCAPCGTALPAKEAHALLAQHKARMQSLSQQPKKQHVQLPATSQAPAGSGSIVGSESQQQQQQQQKLASAASVVCQEAAAVNVKGDTTAAAVAADPDTPTGPDTCHTCTSNCSSCKTEQNEHMPVLRKELDLAVAQESNKQLGLLQQQEQQIQQGAQQLAPAAMLGKVERGVTVKEAKPPSQSEAWSAEEHSQLRDAVRVHGMSCCAEIAGFIGTKTEAQVLRMVQHLKAQKKDRAAAKKDRAAAAAAAAAAAQQAAAGEQKQQQQQTAVTQTVWWCGM